MEPTSPPAGATQPPRVLIADDNPQGVELLDDPRLIGQLAGLQRRVGRAGRDAIEHRSGSHDDRSNAVAGAVVYAARSAGHLAVWPETFNHCRKEADQPLPCCTACLKRSN